MDAKNLMKATYYAKVDIAVVGHVPTVIGAKKAGWGPHFYSRHI